MEEKEEKNVVLPSQLFALVFGQCNVVDVCNFADYSEQFSKVGKKLIESKVCCFLSIPSFKRANAVRLAQDN